MNKSFIKIILILFCFLSVTYAFENQNVDSVSTIIDTVQSENSSLDTLVNYSAADSLVYSLKTRYMYLYGNAKMQYQSMELQSARIDVNWDISTLQSYGTKDSIKQDSIVGKPIMKDGGDEYVGDIVRYNFKTRKGKITLGSTSMDESYYRGKNIKKIDKDAMFIENGTFTTCDNEHPHFYFESPKMKMYLRDKIIAEPVYFYISDVPMFALPFGVFPAHGGRTSGLIMPAYGKNNEYGWYLSHFGYYWAISDYLDVASTFDIYTRGKWQNETYMRYALRYNFNGSITARITSAPLGEPDDPNYKKDKDYFFNLSHNQQISPTSYLQADYTFMSGSYFKNYSLDYNDILKQNMVSTASYSKTWETSNRSISINVKKDQNLVTDEISETLPSISFNQGMIFPFQKNNRTRGNNFQSQDRSFIETIGLSYSFNLNNDRISQLEYDSARTSISSSQLDLMKNFTNTYTQSLNQYLSVSISPKLGYITISPSLSFSDMRNWTRVKFHTMNPEDSLLFDQSDRRRDIKGSMSAGINASTKFYGMMTPNIFGITAFRHTVTPSFGISYNKQIYGDNMQKRSMYGMFNLGNNFEMKYQKNDSAKTEEKVQLLNVGISTSYNFSADSMNFSNVNLSYRTTVGQYFSISGNAVYNLYYFEPKANYGRGSRINKFLINEVGKFGDLTSFSFNLSTSFSGERKKSSQQNNSQINTNNQDDFLNKNRRSFYSIYDRDEADFSIPWSISLRLNFSELRYTPKSYYRSATLGADLSFNITEKWQISVNNISYDFLQKKHIIGSVNVARDLHCWTMNFTWNPMGYWAGYRLEIKVKAPQLQDIKVTKQDDKRGINY